MFPGFEGRNVPHVEVFIIDLLTARDLVLLKLVNKEWSAKISKYIRKSIVLREAWCQFKEAWGRPIDNPTLLKLPQRVRGLQKCTRNNNLLRLGEHWNLVECRANFTELASHSLNVVHFMNHSKWSWVKQAGNLLLVGSLGNMRLFEWRKGSYLERHRQKYVLDMNENSVVFNGRLIIVRQGMNAAHISEVDIDDAILKIWHQSDNPECLNNGNYLQSAVDESSGDFAIFAVDKIHILNGENLSHQLSLELYIACSCYQHLLRKNQSRLKVAYHHPFVATVCMCHLVVWNVVLHQVVYRHSIGIGDIITDMVITNENVLVFVAVNESKEFKTSVFGNVIHSLNSAHYPHCMLNCSHEPFQIMKLRNNHHFKVLAFGTRILLYNNDWRVHPDKGDTIVIGDVWNQDSVPSSCEY
jgi:hypothetical protein